MTDHKVRLFRTYFIAGIVIAFVSLFLDWYGLQGMDSAGALLIDWSHNLLFDWYSPSQLTTELNSWYRPANATVPLPLVIFFMGILAMACFSALLYGSERGLAQPKARTLAFINASVLILSTYFLVMYPIVYLFPNQLLFPVLTFLDTEAKLAFQFSIGLGYWLQLISFACCFPYTALYYSLYNAIDPQANQPSPQSHATPINLDQLIAELELVRDSTLQNPTLPSKSSKKSLSPRTAEEITVEKIMEKYQKIHGREV